MKDKHVYYVKINGIYCEHCRQTRSKELLKIKRVDKVCISGNIAKIECSGSKIKVNTIIQSITNLV